LEAIHDFGDDLIFKAQNVAAAQIVSLRPLRGSTAAIDQLNVYADNSWFTLVDPFQHAIHGHRIHRFSRMASLQKDILRV
jgi:hypothetical protein